MASAGMRLRPDFLILGAPKAGTTALFEYLAKHPSIAAPDRKELDYFWVDSRYARGDAWYESNFPLLRGDVAGVRRTTFEATPHYLACPTSPERIYRYNRDLRLIVLLREPVARAYSQYQHYRRKVGDAARLQRSACQYDEPVRSFFLGLQDPASYGSFSEQVRRELAVIRGDTDEFLPGLLRDGFYARHLERYLQQFSRERLLVIDARRLREKREATLSEITRFLALPTFDWHGELLAEANRGGYPLAIDPRTRRELEKLFSRHNRQLFDLIGERYPGWSY